MLKLEKLHDGAILPARAHPTDSGLDLFSIETQYLHIGQIKKIHTGWKMSVSEGYEIQIRPKSGLSLKGFDVQFGTVDSSFRGEVCVILKNNTNAPIIVKCGQKIAQMVICPVLLWEPEIVDSLDNTDRGNNGFGSTGV